MADIKINNAEYNDVPRLDVPTQSGGVASFYEVSGDLSITENGSYDVTSTESVTVDVAGSGGLTWGDVVRGATETITITETKDMGTYKVIPDHRFQNYDMKKVNITDENEYQIGAYAFADGESLSSVEAPNCLKVCAYAFNKCPSLKTINIPKCKALGASAFRESGIEEFSSTTVATLIDTYHFFRCTSLRKVSLPKVSRLSSYNFTACYNLSEVDMPNLTFIGASAFYNCSSLTEVSFPLVTDVSTEAFYGCSSIVKVTLPSVLQLGMYCFQGCTSLVDVSAPNTKIINNSSFYQCDSLKTLVFESVTTVYQLGLALNKSLELVDFKGASKGSLGSRALYNCAKFKSLILRSENLWTASSNDILQYTLIASGSGYIYVPSALVDSYKTATNWVTYADQFRAIEDYTVDGTVTGELDETKI